MSLQRHDRQRIRRNWGTGVQRRPFLTVVAINALETAATHETVGDILIHRARNIDAEMAELLDHRPGVEGLVSRTSMRSGSTERAVADVTVAPLRASPLFIVTTETPPESTQRQFQRLGAGLDFGDRLVRWLRHSATQATHLFSLMKRNFIVTQASATDIAFHFRHFQQKIKPR